MSAVPKGEHVLAETDKLVMRCAVCQDPLGPGGGAVGAFGLLAQPVEAQAVVLFRLREEVRVVAGCVTWGKERSAGGDHLAGR